MIKCPLKKKAVKYSLGVLNSKDAEQYRQHLDRCNICSREFEKLNYIAKANKYRQKIKSRLPSFSILQYKLENQKSNKPLFNYQNKYKLIPRFALASAAAAAIILFFLNISSKQLRIYYKKGDIKYNKNRIITSYNSECYLHYKKNIFIKLGPDTELAVKRTIKQNQIDLTLNKGTALINKRGKIDLILTASGINIRPVGTKFSAENNNKLKLSLLEGKLLINEKIKLDPGYKARFKEDGSLESMDKLKEKEKIKLAHSFDSLHFVKKWEYKTKGALKAEPVIYNNMLYLGTTDGIVYCIEKESRKLIWKKKFKAGVEAKPEIKEGYLYVGLNNGDLIKLNSDTGTLSWRVKIGTLSYSSPFYYKEKIFTGNTDGYIFSISPDKGKILWEKRLKGGIFAPLLCKNDKIFAGTTDGTVYALDNKNGDILWQKKTKGRIVGSGPVAFGESIVICTEIGNIYNFSLIKGDLLWKHKIDEEILNPPIISKGRLYILSDNLFSFDSRGRLISKSPVNLNKEINISSTDRGFVFTDNLNNIKLFNIKDNKTESLNFGSRISGIAIDTSRIYVTTRSGKVVLFDIIN